MKKEAEEKSIYCGSFENISCQGAGHRGSQMSLAAATNELSMAEHTAHAELMSHLAAAS